MANRRVAYDMKLVQVAWLTLARQILNDWLDRLAQPFIGRFLSFHVWGGLGIAAGLLLALALAAVKSLSLVAVVALFGVVLAVFFGSTYLERLATGRERLVYYRDVLLAVGALGIVLWALGLPILPYLDIGILGIGLFTALGRIGCLMMGCCHGKPGSWGICYRHEHEQDGFPAYLVGVRLLPTQAIEALWTLFLVIVGTGMVLTEQPLGSALAWYALGYAFGRYGLEFLRGDLERRYAAGLSAAQCTSVVVVGVVIVVSVYAGSAFWMAFGLCLFAGMGFLALYILSPRRRQYTLSAAHIHEVAQVIHQARLVAAPEKGAEQRLFMACTSQGVRISFSRSMIERQAPPGVGDAQDAVHPSFATLNHIAFSGEKEPLSAEAAQRLGSLVIKLLNSRQSVNNHDDDNESHRRSPGKESPRWNAEASSNQGVFHFWVWE